MGRSTHGYAETNPDPTLRQPVVSVGLSDHPALVEVNPSVPPIWATGVLSERLIEVLVDLVLAGVADNSGASFLPQSVE